MARLISIQEASNLTGLSVTTLRRGVASGRLPATRANKSMGKIMFDPDLLAQVLRNELYSNIRNGGGWKSFEEKNYDESFEPNDTETTMRNVSNLFSKINKADVTSGLFAPDTFFGKVDEESVTSETLTLSNSTNK